MRQRTRSLSFFICILTVAVTFTLCQKGTQKSTVVTGDEKAAEGGKMTAGKKEIPKPPKVYIGPWKKKGDKPDLFKKAEEEFEKKNYKTALDKYKDFVGIDGTNFWAALSHLKMSRCHYQLSAYDEALEELLGFLGSKPGLIWEARAMTTLAELYMAIPQYGYERDDKVYYNQENREGEYKWMGQENVDTAVSYREKARLAYVGLLDAPKSKRGAEPEDDLQNEAIVNNFSLAEVLMNQFWDHYDSCPPAPPVDPPKPGSPYNPEWTHREKVLMLLDEVEAFSKGRKDTHPVAWAGFRKSLFLMQYPECAPAEWLKEEEKIYKEWSEKHKDEFDPPAYIARLYEAPDDVSPLRILKKVIKEYPDDRDVDLYFGTLGRVREGRGEFVEALKVYEEFLEKYPKSKWIEDVRSSIESIKHPQLSTYGDGVGYPKEDDVVDVSTRNVKDVTIDIYEIDYPAIVREPGRLSDPYQDFTGSYNYFGNLQGAKSAFKKKVATVKYKTKDQGDYRPVSGRVKLPQLPLGSYALNARGGNLENVQFLVRTDMIIVGKPTADSFMFFVTDSMKGRGLGDVSLLVKEVYSDYAQGYYQKVKITEAKTDAGGRYTYKITKGAQVSGNRVQIMAQVGGKISMTSSQYSGYYYQGEGDSSFKIFTYTDRPVYRPGDTIRFKHIVRSYKDGKNVNVPGAKMVLEVWNPKGEKIFTKTQTATAFGTVWGEVKLEEEPPLGVYNARAYVEGNENRSYQSSGSQFRVEEYKKPEFEVEIQPTKSLAAAGEKVSAVIKAAYYWGAPVTEGEVKYKIYRSVYWHSYSPPSKWDWLYGSGFGIPWELPYSGGEELVGDGEGTTDDLGMMEIDLPEMEKDAAYDFEYKVVAEVTDLSRRTINGSGSVKFTRDPFYVYLVTPMFFYSEGDKVETEILAMTADDKPVPAEGTVQVLRLTYPAAENVKEDLLEEAKITLDAKGRAFYKTKVSEAGQYKIVFKGKHEGSKVVTGERLITVAGKEFDKKKFRFQNIEILSQERTYNRGDKIKVLIATPWEDATLWVSHEGGDEVFWEEIKQPKGGSTVLTFEATEGLQPNFFVRVLAVRDNRVNTFERELFIPPSENVLEASVVCSKGEFKPREKGKFTIQVKDYKGKPVQGEFSLAVFDSSVLYIQTETAGDIRPYYYGDRRYIAIYPFHSAQIYFSGFYEDYNKWGTWKTIGLPTSYGYFYIPYQPGTQFLCPSCPEGYSYFGVTTSNAELTMNGGGGGGYGYGGGAAQMAEQPSATPSPVMTESAPKAAKKMDEGEEKGRSKDKAEALGKIGTKGGGGGGPGGGGDEPEMVREYFPDTALWKPDVVTGSDGKAAVDIEWPDSLTTWAVRIVGIDGTNRVAIASSEVITTKKLVARLETPRFMVEGDTAKLAAVVSNAYPEPLEVTLKIKITGEGIEATGVTEKKITVPAGKDARADFDVKAIHAEPVKIQLSAMSSKDEDALIKKFDVLEWGSDKMLSQSEILRKPGKIHLSFDVPKERRKETAELTFVAEPSIAGSLLRALPYLIHYPYGCVEQTMSRFLPAVLVARTLKDSGVKLSSIPKMAEKATLADPLSKKQGEVQMAWWEQPIFDDEELGKIVKYGLQKLYNFQHGDGGWAWWSWGDSDPYMTAYVLIGLVEAREAGYAVDQSVIDRGMSWLKGELDYMNKKPEKEREPKSFVGYALSLDKKVKYADLKDVYDHRESMTHYGQSLIALAMWNVGEQDKARLAVDNLIDVSWTDEKNKTASFKWTEKGWWYWYNNRIETVSWVLRAVETIRPGHKHGDLFAKWLMLNRQGNHWYSTRDTAFALYGMTLYMRQNQELSPDCTVKMLVEGKERKTVKFTKENVLSGEGTVILRGSDIPDGKLDVAVDMQGTCSVYLSGFLTFFTKEPKIEGSGNEIFVDRTYWKLIEKKKKVKSWRGVITKLDYDRVKLEEGDEVKSGDLIEVKIVVESKNDYEYLVFEDYKPAGCEPTELKSGGVFEHGTWVNRELRDEKVVNFLYALPQGKQTISYKMRAEIPGKFKIIPHKAYAMYAPRVRAISDSAEMTITP